VDLAVLIYFIHHIARSIQLPEVIAGIARDLGRSIDAEFPAPRMTPPDLRSKTNGPSLGELRASLEGEGSAVPALTSGYLQFIGYRELLAIAEKADATIELAYRAGHFVIAGRPLAAVWPPDASPKVALALARSHVTGPHRTLVQDPVFAIDQLVEIAIRALSPAVNDTFTALTCIDWLSDGLCKISARPSLERIHRDGHGRIRVIEPRVRTAYTNVATNTPSVTCVPTSRTKFRSIRGPNCWEARVRARIVIENTTPITVMTAAAIPMSTCRAASALPGWIQWGRERRPS